MNASPFQWDKTETFTGSNGQPGIRYAISDHDGVSVEFSMHDPTIKELVEPEQWVPVFTSDMVNSKIDRINGHLVILCGFGKPKDPMGNLLMFRVSHRPGFSRARMDQIVKLIFATLMGFGIRIDQKMQDAVRGN